MHAREALTGPRRADPQSARVRAEETPAARARRLERERRIAQQRRRAQARAATVAAIILLGGCGWTVLYRSPAFRVRRIDVVGNARITAEQVRRLADVPSDATLLRFPGRAVERRLVADAWVSSAMVTRDFPDAMRIRVFERVAVALVDTGDTFWVVDRTGMVLEKQSPEVTSALPVVRDVAGLDPKVGRRMDTESLKNALTALVGVSDDLRSVVRAVSAPSIDRTALITTSGVEIYVGEATQLSTKDFIIRRILREQKAAVVFIDVRTTERPVWRGLGKGR